MKGKTRYARETFRLYLPPTVGYNYPHLLNLLRKYGVDKGLHGRAFIVSAISMIGVPFRIYERFAYDKKAEKVDFKEPPVFILGHWRSGTTHLHNLLCQDPLASFVTTYQSVFPDQTLAAGSRFLFKNIMKMIMPLKRAGDNIKLNTEYPQEEEFTLGARNPVCFYYFFYYPELITKFYDQYLNFSTSDDLTRNTFIADYKRVINKAQLYSGNQRFLSKNPANTARIPLLLEMYPDARFIHIYRNPVDVILSTRHFFSHMMPGLNLHKIDFESVNSDIFDIYNRMMHDYLETRDLIPEGNLAEVRYEELSKNPEQEIKRIYDQFGFEGYEKASPLVQKYAEAKRAYVKNKYSIKKSLLDEILSNVEFTMKEWNYDIPGNLDIVDS
ncbi:MAG: sulfotransferase [Bacteroidales bacterium]|jgi:hypothetical protein|nr:sulfotransferase [Bacteroidales bacterium]